MRVGILLAGLTVTLPEAALAQGDAPLPAKSYGPGFSLPDPGANADAGSAGGGISEYDLSLGCIVGGTAGTAISLGVGGMNVVNLIAGGLVPATSPVAMWAALGGVVFASFCSLGQALTPAAMASYSYLVPPQPELGGPAMDARYCQVAEALPPLTPPAGRALPARHARLAGPM